MTATICIPARLQSTRLERKLLRVIEGKPLIQYTFENLKQAGFNNIVILADDVSIQQAAIKFGASCLMTPITCINGTERIACALEQYPELFPHDLIVNVQGDEPLLDTNALKNMINKHLQNPHINTYTLYRKISYQEAQLPSVVKVVISQDNQALYFSRSIIPYSKEPAKTFYYQHIGVYSYQKNLLQKLKTLSPTPCQLLEDLEQLKMLEKGYTIFAEESTKPSLGIDTIHDLKLFEDIVCNQNIYL